MSTYIVFVPHMKFDIKWSAGRDVNLEDEELVDDV